MNGNSLFKLILFGLFLACFPSCSTDINESSESIEVRLLKKISRHRAMEYQAEGFQLPVNSTAVDLDGTRFNLIDLVQDNKIVLRISQRNCNECNQAAIEILKELLTYDKALKDKIIILYSTYDQQYDSYLLKNYDYLEDLSLYRVREEFGDTRIDDEYLPYLFFLDGNLSMRNVHVPVKELPLIAKSYLSFLFERFENIERQL